MTSCSGTEARARALLGTLVGIRVRDPGACRDLAAAFGAAFAAIARVQALMSFHEPTSELSRLNRAAPGAPVEVASWTRAVLRRAAQIGAASAGVFDCAVAPVRVRAGLVPAPCGTPAPTAALRFHEAIEFLGDGRVRLAAPLWVDLGGIAKGFAVDRAIEVLAARGVRSASVNAGGDLRVLGETPERMHVRLADDGARVAPLAELANAALATSASAAMAGATPFVDPATGAACGHGMSASVIAPDCTTADALTKVVLVSGDAHHPALARFAASARLFGRGSLPEAA